MELFVVNRHDTDTAPDSEKCDEQAKLQKIFQKIEKNKKIRNKQKEKAQKIKEAKQKTLENRNKKRQLKAKIIPVTENTENEFLKADFSVEDGEKIAENTEESSKPPERKKKKLEVNVEGFTVLGLENTSNKVKVKRVLPKWLSNPTIISSDLQNLQQKVSEFKEIDKPLRKLLKKNGVKFLFPVQTTVIPWLINSHRHSDVMFPQDICVSAPTGSGKTLAFVLPVIQSLKKHTVKRIRALVILPTQDLAKQVFKTFKTYTENTGIDVGLITGQNSFEIEQKQLVIPNEAFGYVSKMDILICTAGRLVDHIKETAGFNLQYLEFLIIDEADRVLESVQNDWLYHLEKHIQGEDEFLPNVLNLITLQKRRPPQKLLFSATLSQDPEKLKKLSLFQPKLFTAVVKSTEDDQKERETFVGKYTTPMELTEKFAVVSVELKPLLVYNLVRQLKLTKTLIFTHSLESTHRLTILLKSMFKGELSVEEISSHLQGRTRDELIKRFSEGKIDLLICTDALARGIDLPGVKCVVSYSAPKHLKTYIHRAGRTARAGEEGLTISLLHPSQLAKFKGLLKLADKTNVEELKIDEADLEPLGEQYKESLEKLKQTVVEEEKAEVKKNLAAKKSRVSIKKKRKFSG